MPRREQPELKVEQIDLALRINAHIEALEKEFKAKKKEIDYRYHELNKQRRCSTEEIKEFNAWAREREKERYDILTKLNDHRRALKVINDIFKEIRENEKNHPKDRLLPIEYSDDPLPVAVVKRKKG